MTPEQYDRIRAIFLEARGNAGGERADFLRRACGGDERLRKEVESLLANDEGAGTFLLTPALGEDFAVNRPEWLVSGSGSFSGSHAQGRTDIPDRIGQYRVVDVLGEGGMGVVYRAEQENPRRPVALKVIRPGVQSAEMLRRFEHEGQVLAWLQHPGIAQVFETSTADTGRGPQPFFAMELVVGEPLTRHANEHRLDTRARLELMGKVCDAVQHAHQRGVIHRDLKPANVLVDGSEQPKIVDFGVARATDADIRATTLGTDAGQLVGTLAYMSPEQVSGNPSELDTRSDVYALGVMLYELLSGRVPLDVSGKTIPQAVRMIVEQESPRLSSIRRALRGDIQTIVAKALEKDKNRRYSSAADLAADIRRYLSDQPISARPGTTLYQLGKFAKRNKALVAGVAVAFATLGVALIYVTRQRDRAIAAEALAGQRLVQVRAEADKVWATNQFLNGMLASADPAREGREVRVADVLDRAAQTVGQQLPAQPEIEAALRTTIGTTYVALGLYAEAEPHLRSALKTRSRLFGDESPDTLASMTNLAAALKEIGRAAEASDLVRRVLDVRQRTLGADHRSTLDAMNNLADLLQREGRVAEAETLWRDALAGQRRVLDPRDPQRAITMSNLGQLLKQLRRPSEAEPLLRQALDLQVEVLGEDHPQTLATMGNLSNTLQALKMQPEAEALARRVVEARRRTFGDHPSVYTAVNNLARLLRDQGRFSEAEPYAQESLEGFRRTSGARSESALLAMNNLGSLWVELGRAAEAEPLFAELIETAGQTLPAGHWMVMIFEANYGQCLTALGRYEEAESSLVAAYDGLKGSLGARHQHTHKTLVKLIELYEAWGKTNEAARYRAAALGDPGGSR